MSERTAKLLSELKETVSKGVDSRNIEQETGITILSIIYELNSELRNDKSENGLELRGIRNELRGIGESLNSINQKLGRRR